MDEPVDDPVDDPVDRTPAAGPDGGVAPAQGPSPGTAADGGPSSQPRLALRYAALSDVGQVRKDNQDSGFASEHLLVVADGVGGAARGDVASSTAVQALRRLDGPPPGDMLEALAGAVHRAHDRIAELVEQDPALDGTSTTVTSALFDGARLGVAHVGDSRGYLLRDGTLSQLTRDHTFVQSLVDEGRITEEESRTHPHRNLILRAVDGVHETDPDLFVVDLAPGDRLMLCSDGASGVLDRNRITDILGSGSVDYAAVELVRASLEAGSSDNVTCVVADVVPAEEGASGDPVVVGAAADLSRPSGKGLFRGHRSGDTGELEPVAGEGGAAGTSADPEELRYAPREPRRRRWPRRIAALVVVLVVLGVAGLLAYQWSQQQYFVASHGDKVAIYRGVQADVPGVSMNSVEEDTDITVAALPDYSTEQVRAGIAAESLSDARSIVRNLTKMATVCPTPSSNPIPTMSRPSRRPRASSSSRASTAAQPSSTPTRSPTSAPSPSASPSPSATVSPPDCIKVSP